MALNNLWSYLQGLKLAQKDRNWLAGKLLEASSEDIETKESLYSALNEVEAAKRGEIEMMTEEEFLEGLKKDGLL